MWLDWYLFVHHIFRLNKRQINIYIHISMNVLAEYMIIWLHIHSHTFFWKCLWWVLFLNPINDSVPCCDQKEKRKQSRSQIWLQPTSIINDGWQVIQLPILAQQLKNTEVHSFVLHACPTSIWWQMHSIWQTTIYNSICFSYQLQ